MSEEYKTVNKQARVLLTLMTGLPEFQFFKQDNDKLILKDSDLPIWSGNIRSLEALIELTDEYNDDR